jgi:hypothetical protein
MRSRINEKSEFLTLPERRGKPRYFPMLVVWRNSRMLSRSATLVLERFLEARNLDF